MVDRKLRACGFKRVTSAQWDRLGEVADRHDDRRRGVDGWGWIVERLEELDEGTDPLAHVFTADRDWKADRAADAARKEREAAAEKRRLNGADRRSGGGLEPVAAGVQTVRPKIVGERP